jgi:hypothetical protein
MSNVFAEKLKNYKEQETLKERGTKRFQERIAEEKEAEQLIKDYIHEEQETLDNDQHPTIS